MKHPSASRRALVLAGGGIRVAWQAGALVALDEEGIDFDHVDGTSGGIFNAAMLLSGLGPAEMCERWMTLPVRSFVTPLPLRTYLRGISQLPAIASGDGILDRVLPHLGVDIDTINNAPPMSGTINVCEFSTKTNRTIPHDRMTADLLLAGVSLPGLMPIVGDDADPTAPTGAESFIDAVWIQDANLLEAVRRGANEIWLLWCIGNTPRYGRGWLEQYVHMIEMSAVGALNRELFDIAQINRRRADGEAVYGSTDPVRLHVLKPPRPLPLDPWYLAGRIDAHGLCGTGYRHAARYLRQRSVDGVPLDPSASAMAPTPLGIGWREELRGHTEAGLTTELRFTTSLQVDGGRSAAEVVGSVSIAGERRWIADGRADLADSMLTIIGRLGPDWFEAQRPWTGRPWSDLRTGTIEIHGADGIHHRAELAATNRLRSVVSIEPSGAHSLADRLKAGAGLVARVRRARRSVDSDG